MLCGIWSWRFYHLVHQTLLNLALGKGLEDRFFHHHWKVSELLEGPLLGFDVKHTPQHFLHLLSPLAALVWHP